MTIEDLNRRVWEEMVYANMRTNYFGDLVRTYQERDKWFRVAGLVLSSGSLASAVWTLEPQHRVIVPLLATAGSVWLLLSQYSTLSRDASDLMSSWQNIATKYERLFNGLEAPDAESQFDKIYEEADRLSKPAGKFPQNQKKLEHWLNRSSEILIARYTPKSTVSA